MVARSYLFVPGNRQHMLDKALSRGADAVIVDLEDAVAESEKTEARRQTIRWLDTTTDDPNRSEVWVRVNSGNRGTDDIEALGGQTIEGVVLPKVGGASEVARVIATLADAALFRNVIVLVETARSVQAVDEIAAVEGVYQLMLGEADLGAELGVFPRETSWDSIRLRLVIASAAANIAPPIGPVEPNYSNIDSFVTDTEHLRRLGFSSRAAIHPAQIQPINAALTPTPAEIERATEILRLHEGLDPKRRGSFVGPDGHMIDEAYIRWARRILARESL